MNHDQQIPPGYKQTEIGVIPEDWDIKPLQDIAYIERGKFTARPRNDPKYYGGDIPFIQTGDVTNSNGRIKTYIQTLNEEGLKVSKLFTIETMFFTIAANIGDIGFASFAAACPDSLVAINPEKIINKYWLSYELRWRKKSFENLATHNAQLNINLDKLRPYLVPIPTLTEQQSIAEALSDADALIESLEELLTKKRQIKQGAMQELLTGKKRLPGFGGEWGVRRLGSLANIQRGASPRPIDNPIWFDENSSVGWVRISDVTKSEMFLLETTQRLSLLGIKNSRSVNRGSLIMSICATVGRPIISEIDICIHDGFVVFENLQVAKQFLYYILKSIESDWSEHGQTGSQMNLNTGLINRTEIAVPKTKEEQTAIAAILSDMDAEIDALEAKLAKARQIKQGMMQELLTGRIRLI